jgi:hypothetical protein
VLGNTSFVCAKTQLSRVNQLGNARNDDITSQSQALSMGKSETNAPHGVNANRFMWTIPKIPKAKHGTKYFHNMDQAYKSCTLRMRYNVSSGDFQQVLMPSVDCYHEF